MRQALTRSMILLMSLIGGSLLVFGQISSTSSLSGVVIDASGAVIPGAEITAKSYTNGAEFKALSVDNGTFTIPALAAGTYTVIVMVPGFKQAILKDVKVDAATPASVRVTLEVGAQSEQIIVQGGSEVLQTQSANVATTITGRQIVDLPFTSRDALDLVLLLPGTATPGRPRTSSVNGLPKGALNITLDGVNVQDNTLKSSDGFFTYIRPRIDAIDEVTVSTATPGAESSAEGAIQIKFVTRSGTNEYHGSLYEYHRNPALNANYWFNNRDLLPDPRTGKAPRDRVLLNQYGFRFGGPISVPKLFSGRDRAFFFVNYEEYRLPEQVTRQRTLLNPLTQQGTFQYVTSSGVQQVNLFELASSKGFPSTPDPTIAKLLADIQASTTRTGGLQQLSDPNYQRFTFTNTGGQARYFPTIRFDFNLTAKHHIENVYNYQKFDSVMDFLNGVDPAFPGFPNHASQVSNRFSNVMALRSTLTTTLVNEARFGLTGGTVLFFPEVSTADFNGPVANQGGYRLDISAAGITNPTVTAGPSRRNAPVWQYSDTLSWTRKTHTLNMGLSFSQVNFWGSSYNSIVPRIAFGIDSTDPASALFVADNFPGASGTQRGQAAGIYATLIGRVTQIGGNAYADEVTGEYQYLGAFVQRARMREWGLFISDSWRYRPNLTLNYGLRYEVQGPFTALNSNFAVTPYEQLFGVSGAGNLFKPGTLTGRETQFNEFKPGQKAWNTDWNNLAPTFGFAWSPTFKNGALRRVLGEGGQTVIRGGYSVAYNREGMNLMLSILGSNPGGFVSATRNISLGNLTPGTMFRDRASLGPPSLPSAPAYPLTGTVNDGANAFDPNLKLGYVQSWTLGLQRELTKDMVVELRYVANRGVKQWRQYNLNEINVVENKFIDEFALAQTNLQANIAAGRGQSFAYFGPGTGTSPLPVILAYAAGIPAAQAGDASRYAASFFNNTDRVNLLAPDSPLPQALAANLFSAAGQRANAASAGLPANLFVVNPGKLGGAFLVDNGGHTSYDGLVVELRRRMAHGLLVQGSYALSKGITNMYASSSVVFKQYLSLRTTERDKTISPFDVTHAWKLNWIYELPFGRGKNWLANTNGFADHFLGGWEFHGTSRIQSGTPFNFGNVNLVGMTRSELQDAIQIRFDDPNKIAYFLPQDIIDNTRRAFNVNPTGYSALGAPTGRYIAPASNRGCIQAYGGQCGFSNLILYGPRFVRFDLSAVKKFRIAESVNFELRGEFLNAFNNINFRTTDPGGDVGVVGGFAGQTFGQTTFAYRDLSTTNDPGGRLIQFVARINF